MAITVTTSKGVLVYDQGSDWFIDDDDLLHVRDAAKKHIAAYHRSAWESVASGEPRMTEERRAEHETRRVEAEARARAEAEVRARRGGI